MKKYKISKSFDITKAPMQHWVFLLKEPNLDLGITMEPFHRKVTVDIPEFTYKEDIE